MAQKNNLNFEQEYVDISKVCLVRMDKKVK